MSLWMNDQRVPRNNKKIRERSSGDITGARPELSRRREAVSWRSRSNWPSKPWLVRERRDICSLASPYVERYPQGQCMHLPIPGNKAWCDLGTWTYCIISGPVFIPPAAAAFAGSRRPAWNKVRTTPRRRSQHRSGALDRSGGSWPACRCHDGDGCVMGIKY
jgi:hypothetical protein